MSVTVDIDLGYDFRVKSAFKDVYALLADVPAAARFFPEVDVLLDQGGGVYRWQLLPLGSAQLSIQTVYACRYAAEQNQAGTLGSVVWTPVKGVGNAQVAGCWQLGAAAPVEGPATDLVFKVQAAVDVPLPALTKAMVAPKVRRAFESLAGRYIDNLVGHFGGRA